MWKTLPSHKDAISGVKFGPNNLLLSCSWDNTLAITDLDQVKFALRVTVRAPLLACAWNPDGETVYGGGVETRVTNVDIKTQKLWDIGGDHSQAISCMTYAAATNSIVTGSFDGTLQLVDSRKETGYFYSLGRKIFSLDAAGTALVVGMSDNVVNGYDLRKLSEPLFSRKLHYDHPLRSVRMMPDATGYAVSSLKSRVTIESFSPRSGPRRSSKFGESEEMLEFSFRSNRKALAKEDGKTHEAYPINCIAFHPQLPHVATGGSDKTIQVWDYKNRRKVVQHDKMPYGVSQLDYSEDGQFLAAGGYDDSFRMAPAMSAHPLSSVLMVKSLE